ncbi:MAG: class I SAM-dependent methyltransferase [Rhodobacteraceae bacterium]|nr:class I SAM-dependent methyltransferase [Paracoccaceae bacterium]
MAITVPDANALPKIAPMMAALGAHLCGPACQDYHRAWGFLRLYGTLPAVGRDHEILLSTLRSEIRGGRRNVLVSGSADAGILAYVLESLRSEDATGRVAVVDRCPTPLAVNTWYAAQIGWPIETWCGSVQDYCGRGFELVVAHNFLNSIAPGDRPSICQSWHDALKPGGRVAMITQIKPAGEECGLRFDANKTALLIDDLLQARKGSKHADLISAEELAVIATSFAEARYSYRLRQRSDITGPLEAAGLRVLEYRDYRPSLETSNAELKRTRLVVIAERPE